MVVRKHITIDIEKVSDYSDLVCKYVFKKGDSKGNTCYVRNYCDGYCLKHFKLVQKSAEKDNINKCQYITKNGLCGRKATDQNTCKYHKIDKKKSDIKIVPIDNLKKNNYNKLICYYNDYNDKITINNISIIDIFPINKVNNSLLICYNNDGSLFKKYLSKLKKKIKKRKYKKQKKRKINANIKIEYFNEGKDPFGFPISFKRKSPFPNEEITIDNILYKNSYYEWYNVKKKVYLYCIDKKNNNKKIFIYSINRFEEMLLDIYTKETVNRYFGY